MIKLSKPNIPEIAITAMNDIIRSGQLVHGAECIQFEQELAAYLDVKHACVVSNGTAALHLALLALDIGPGDAVIVPDFTYPATANAVAMVGATPVIVDVCPQTYCLSVSELEKTIAQWQGPERLKAIMPVHEFGHPADMNAINELAKKYALYVVEDAACALGAVDGQLKMGAASDIGCFSFHPRKTLTTGEGGLVVTNSDEVADKLRRLRNHGMERTDAGMKFFYPGLNYRLTNFQAALGRFQLAQLDQWIQKRKTLASFYLQRLAPLAEAGKLRLPSAHVGHSWQTFMIVLSSQFNRDDIVVQLREKGVETSLGAQSLSTLAIYSNHWNDANQFETGSTLYRQGLALPFCELYSEAELQQVVDTISTLLC